MSPRIEMNEKDSILSLLRRTNSFMTPCPWLVRHKGNHVDGAAAFSSSYVSVCVLFQFQLSVDKVLIVRLLTDCE